MQEDALVSWSCIKCTGTLPRTIRIICRSFQGASILVDERISSGALSNSIETDARREMPGTGFNKQFNWRKVWMPAKQRASYRPAVAARQWYKSITHANRQPRLCDCMLVTLLLLSFTRRLQISSMKYTKVKLCIMRASYSHLHKVSYLVLCSYGIEPSCPI